MMFKRGKPQHSCEDIKKARNLLKESGARLQRKLDEQSELIKEYEKPKPVLVLISSH